MKKIKGVFRFNIKRGSEEAWWIVDAKNGSGSLKFMAPGMRTVSPVRKRKISARLHSISCMLS